MAKHRKHGDNIEFVPFEPEDWADFALEDWEPPTLDVWADTFEPLAEKSNNVTPKPR